MAVKGRNVTNYEDLRPPKRFLFCEGWTGLIRRAMTEGNSLAAPQDVGLPLRAEAPRSLIDLAVWNNESASGGRIISFTARHCPITGLPCHFTFVVYFCAVHRRSLTEAGREGGDFRLRLRHTYGVHFLTVTQMLCICLCSPSHRERCPWEASEKKKAASEC